MDLNTTRRLNNGVEMPMMGLGVFRSQDGQETVDAVRWALEAGYRHIDTAASYGNEESVGEGLRQSGVPREEVFITTKLWTTEMRAGKQRESFLRSLEKLGVDYIDLYLIHWPAPLVYKPSYRIVENLYKEGLIRAIGVSNFHEWHMEDLLEEAEVVPAVNQIEFHPLLTQLPLIKYCEKIGCAPEAWSPLGAGHLLNDERVVSLAKKYGKTPAQVLLRWDLQMNVITIPKSVKKERIIENSKIFDFELTLEDMAILAAMNTCTHFGKNPDIWSF